MTNSVRSESGTMLSYQSPMPAAAGTPGYKNWVHWLMEGSGVVRATHPTPSWGQAPALHFFCGPGVSLFGRRWLVSPASAGIHPGSESGTCFTYQSPMPAAAGTPRYENKTWSLEVFGCGWCHPSPWIPASARMTNSESGTCLRSIGRIWQIRVAGEAPRRLPAHSTPPGT